MDKITELTNRYECLSSCTEQIRQSINMLVDCFKKGGKLMICGNGGSAADSSHIVGELVKGFLSKRRVTNETISHLQDLNSNLDEEFFKNLQYGLPAIDLCQSSALISAFANDVNPDFVYAQEVFALGKENDVLMGISTSGNAVNVNNAAKIAKGMGISVIGLTGTNYSKLSNNSDICIKVPETETFKVQELHLPIYHCLCAAVEEILFK